MAFAESFLLRQHRTITALRALSALALLRKSFTMRRPCRFLGFCCWHRANLFRHLAQISLERRQPSCAQFAQSDVARCHRHLPKVAARTQRQQSKCRANIWRRNRSTIIVRCCLKEESFRFASLFLCYNKLK